jgi:aarF domain-containing kinase
MTAEWIDGVRLSDRPAIRRLMGERDSNIPISGSTLNRYVHTGPSLSGGVKSIMETMVSLFSAQMFSWGWVHCDPHPGNIIIRPNPSRPSQPQLVLLDHGLYVRLSDTFRRQYAELWRGLLGGDWAVVEDITKAWGIGTPDLFASATMLKPVRFGSAAKNGSGSGKANGEEITQYEQSVRLKAKLKQFLTDTDKCPKELIFLGRNMRLDPS